MRQSWETMTSVSDSHIILTPARSVGGERPQQESNAGTSSPGVGRSTDWAAAPQRIKHNLHLIIDHILLAQPTLMETHNYSGDCAKFTYRKYFMHMYL